VIFRVGDLQKARRFLSDVLGFEEAFRVKDTRGRLLGLNFKVNDDQFLEFSPNGRDEGGFYLQLVSLLTPDIQKAHQTLRERQCDHGGEIRWINLMMPGDQGDYLELMVHAAHPPVRRQHVCFVIPDIHLTHKHLFERGLPPRFKPFLVQTGQWLMNIRDPNGIRVEFMEVK